jgi:lipid-A-disaccharide synthase-like uncharacterized protein
MDLLFYILAILFSLVIVTNIFSSEVTKDKKIKYTLYLVSIITASMVLSYITNKNTVIVKTEVHDVIELKANNVDMCFSEPKTITETKTTYASWSFKSNKDTFNIKDQQ